MCSNVGFTCIARLTTVLVCVTLACALLAPRGGAVPLSDFFPFNGTAGDTKTDSSDDGGSGRIQLETTFPFFNRSHNTTFVNNNGVISFLKELKTYRPENFPLKDDAPIIAPFWADVDVQVGGTVWYRESTDEDILKKASGEINKYFHNLGKFKATWVFVATWDDVGFYGASEGGKNKRNTFQAVLITDNKMSFVIFNYHKIQWTTGSNSGGETTTGLGGNPAQAGFNAGDGINYMEIEGARKPAVLNLTLTTNVEIPGKWAFRVDAVTIEGSCSQTGSGRLFVRPLSGSVLGGENITLSGPCFEEGAELEARFDDLNQTFPCYVLSSSLATCITPTVFRTGQLSVSLNVNNVGWNYTGIYITESIVQLNQPSIVRANPGKWIIGTSVQISWEASRIPSDNVTVELLEYKEINGTPSFRTVVNFTGVANTDTTFPFKLAEIAEAGIIRVSAEPAHSNRTSVALWSDVFPAIWKDSGRSRDWCLAWQADQHVEVNLTQTQPCPCTRRQAAGDTGRYQPDPLCNSLAKDDEEGHCQYRGEATDCIMLNFQGSSQGSQVCCYDSNGELLDARGVKGGGTLGRYHYRSQGPDTIAFFSYFTEDILPYLHCCQYADNSSMCHNFLKTYRPYVTCRGYSPPAAAQAAGDPHLVSLDGKGFTFNGEGDFVLLQDASGNVRVHVRTARAVNTSGVAQNATVFTAAAMQVRNVTPVVELHMDADDIVALYVDGALRDLKSSTSDIDGLTVYYNKTSNSTAEVTVVMDTVGVSILIQATKDLFNIMVMVGSQELKGKLKGLLGNYNGDKSDDLRARNGSVLPEDASMRMIHYDFGMTWLVLRNESMFTDQAESDSEPFAPVFLNEMGNDSAPSDTAQVCGDNLQCKFDYQVTQNADIATSIKAFNQRFEERLQGIQKVVRCDSYMEVQDGFCNLTSGNSNGSEARCECNDGFEPTGGATVRVCQTDGNWSGELLECGKKTHSSPGIELSTQVLVYIGAGSAGFIFVVLIVVVAVCRCRSCRRSRRKPKDDEEPTDIPLPSIFTPSDIPTPVFENPNFVESLDKLWRGGSFRIPRPTYTYVDPHIYEEYF